MNPKQFLSSLSVDHASSWGHLFNFYFYNFTPYFIYIPERFYGKVLAGFGILAFCHICLNVGRFLKNKKKIANRQERTRLNLQELKTYLDNTYELTDLEMEITEFSFDDLSSKLREGSLNPLQVLVAFQRKALKTQKANAVAEYILNKDVTMTTPIDPTAEDTDALFGIPISFSELIELHEKDRTIGLGGFVGVPAKSDAHVVKLLKASGAVPFIRTNTAQAPTFCPSIASSNPIFGRTSHPISSLRSAGGGSCGEACALALNASVLGVGADLVGGLRIPANFCGVAALRITPQRVSTHGLMQGQSLVSTCVGPIAREVSGLVAFMRSVCGSHQADLDPTLPNLPFDNDLFSSTDKLRIGYFVEDGCTRTTPAVSRAIRDAKRYLEKQGHRLVQFVPPDMQNMMSELLYPAAMGSNWVLWQLLSVDVVDPGIRQTYYRIQVNNALRWLFSWWRSSETPIVAALDASAMPLTMEDWWHLTNKVEEFRKEFSHKWKLARLDVLLCPVMPFAAVKTENEPRVLACLTHVGLFSLLNYPAGTVPVTEVKKRDLLQFQSSSSYLAQTSLDRLIVQDQVGDMTNSESSVLGYPVGVQVAALPYREETVLRVMQELEAGCKRASFCPTTAATSGPDQSPDDDGSDFMVSDGVPTASPKGTELSPSDISVNSEDDDGNRERESVPIISVSISKLKNVVRESSSKVGSAIRGSLKRIRSVSKKRKSSGSVEAEIPVALEIELPKEVAETAEAAGRKGSTTIRGSIRSHGTREFAAAGPRGSTATPGSIKGSKTSHNSIEAKGSKTSRDSGGSIKSRKRRGSTEKDGPKGNSETTVQPASTASAETVAEKESLWTQASRTTVGTIDAFSFIDSATQPTSPVATGVRESKESQRSRASAGSIVATNQPTSPVATGVRESKESQRSRPSAGSIDATNKPTIPVAMGVRESKESQRSRASAGSIDATYQPTSPVATGVRESKENQRSRASAGSIDATNQPANDGGKERRNSKASAGSNEIINLSGNSGSKEMRESTDDIGSKGKRESMDIVGSKGKRESMDIVGSKGKRESMDSVGSKGKRKSMANVGSKGVQESTDSDEPKEIRKSIGSVGSKGKRESMVITNLKGKQESTDSGESKETAYFSTNSEPMVPRGSRGTIVRSSTDSEGSNHTVKFSGESSAPKRPSQNPKEDESSEDYYDTYLNIASN